MQRIVSFMMVCLSAHLLAQIVEPAPKRFEVASVKPSRATEDQSKLSSGNPGRFIAINIPLRFLILRAYGLKDHELADAPEWTRDEGFDVIGTYSPDLRPSDSDITAMLQDLWQRGSASNCIVRHAKSRITN